MYYLGEKKIRNINRNRKRREKVSIVYLLKASFLFALFFLFSSFFALFKREKAAKSFV
jgi:hypothetical protein